MAVHADAVSDPVREVLVLGAESSVHDHLARGRVHVFRWDARPGGLPCRGLRRELDVEDALHSVCRTSEYERAAYVRPVALDPAAAVDEQDRAFADHLWRDRPVGERRVLPRLHARASLEAESVVRHADEVAEVPLRHSLFHRQISGLVRGERHLVGKFHELDLMLVLGGTAARRDRGSADDLEAGCGVCHTVAEAELYRLFRPDPTRGDAAIAKALRDPLVGALVLFPCPNFRAAQRAERELLAGAVLLERGADDEGVAPDRHDDREQPLPAAPADVREVDHRCAAREKEGVDIVGPHQAFRLLDTCGALFAGDRASPVCPRAETRDGRRHLLGRRCGEQRLWSGERGARGGGGRGTEEVTSRNHSHLQWRAQVRRVGRA